MKLYDVATIKPSSPWREGKDGGKEIIIKEVSGMAAYSVIGMDGTGGGAWFHDSDLEFVRHGSRTDLDEANQKKDEIGTLQANLSWIRENWESLKSGISANSILALFHEVGYSSSFEKNGEYFVLQDDWVGLFPIFDAVMRGDLPDVVYKIREIFKPDYVSGYIKSFTTLHSKIHTNS